MVFRLAATSPGRWFCHHYFATLGPSVDRLLFRISGGRLMSVSAVVPMLLLTTRGRHSGRPRSVPLAFRRQGSAVVVVASNAGRRRDPGWLLNLKAHNQATIKYGGKTVLCSARVAEGEEWGRLWDFLTEQTPTYEMYERLAGRRLPIVVLTPFWQAAITAMPA